MHVKDYLKALDEARSDSTIFTCPYCGARTPGFATGTICVNCENVIPIPLTAPYDDQQRAALLDDIFKHVKGKNYQEAYSIYEKLPGFQSDPSMIYSEALAYIEDSNYETSLITYDKEGFMEENTVHRDNSVKLFSQARMLLNKSISICKAAERTNGNVQTTYLQFLAYLKLGDMKAADYFAGKIKGWGNTFLENYSAMLLSNALGEYDKVLEHAESLLAKDTFSINALYYSAYALFKEGKISDAKELLSRLLALVDSAPAAILKDIMQNL